MKKLFYLVSIAAMLGGGIIHGMGQSTVGEKLSPITLVGASIQLGNKLKRGSGASVTVLESGGKAASGSLTTHKGSPYVAPINYSLPVKLQINYDDKVYTAIIRDTMQQGTCPKFNNRVEAEIYGGTATVKKSICVPKSTGLFFGGNALRWQNIIIALADNPDYSINSKSETLPFKFSLSSWTSNEAPWNTTKLARDPHTGRTYENGLKIIQGIHAWGGGDIPKPGFTSIGIIYNLSPYILLFERRSRDATLSKYDFNELIPGMVKPSKEKVKDSDGKEIEIDVPGVGGTVAPLALPWLPKVNLQQYVSPDSAIYIYPFITPKNAGLVDPNLLIDSKNPLANQNAESSNQTVKDEIQNIKNQIPVETFSLVDDAFYGMLSADDTASFLKSKYYYKIYSSADRTQVRIDKCDITTQSCENIKSFSLPAPAVANVPNFVRLLIEKNNDPSTKQNSSLNFEITALPGDLLKKK